MNINDVLATSLADHLSELGVFVRSVPGGAEAVLLGATSKCAVNVGDVRQGNGGFSAIANVSIDLGNGHAVEDLLLGGGATVETALVSAVDQFVGGMVAPIAALAQNFDCKQWRCQMTNFEAPSDKGNGYWNMAIGQILSNDTTGQLYNLADQHPPLFEVFTPIAQHIIDLDDRNPHWVKIYLCRYPDGIDGEVRMDNQLHENALKTLSNFKWPTDQPLIWFRQFAFLEPADDTARRWAALPVAQTEATTRL